MGRSNSLASFLLPTRKCKPTHKHVEIILAMSKSLFFFWHKQEYRELIMCLFPSREAFSEDGRANSWKTNAEGGKAYLYFSNSKLADIYSVDTLPQKTITAQWQLLD